MAERADSSGVLAVGLNGHRSGHPEVDRPVLTVPEAAGGRWLNTSTNTVRSLIISGSIDGFWFTRGDTFGYRAYRDDVERFITENGRFPAARHRRRRFERHSRSASMPRLEHQVPPGLPTLQREVEGLRAALERHAERIDHLTTTLRSMQESASRGQDATRRYVLQYIRDALSDGLG